VNDPVKKEMVPIREEFDWGKITSILEKNVSSLGEFISGRN
jgi:hypothetical protein